MVRTEWFMGREDLPLGAPGAESQIAQSPLYGLVLSELAARCYYDRDGLSFMFAIYLELQLNIVLQLLGGDMCCTFRRCDWPDHVMSINS